MIDSLCQTQSKYIIYFEMKFLGRKLYDRKYWTEMVIIIQLFDLGRWSRTFRNNAPEIKKNWGWGLLILRKRPWHRLWERSWSTRERRQYYNGISQSDPNVEESSVSERSKFQSKWFHLYGSWFAPWTPLKGYALDMAWGLNWRPISLGVVRPLAII